MTNRAHGYAKVLARDLRACERMRRLNAELAEHAEKSLGISSFGGLRGLCVERDLFTTSSAGPCLITKTRSARRDTKNASWFFAIFVAS